MDLLGKLLNIQLNIESFIKDSMVGEGKSAYAAVGSEQVLEKIRPLMNQNKLLLIPSVKSANVIVGTTSTGTQRFFTELYMEMKWIDVESKEEMIVPWYGQGVDLAGEKGVGKAQTYAEKYFFLKFFHVPTPKDDPDGDKIIKSGEKAIIGTQAQKETEKLQKNSINQMLWEIYGKDNTDKHQEAMIFLTKSKDGKNLGIDNVNRFSSPTHLAVVYAELKKQFKKKMGKEFQYDPKLFDN